MTFLLKFNCNSNWSFYFVYFFDPKFTRKKTSLTTLEFSARFDYFFYIFLSLLDLKRWSLLLEWKFAKLNVVFDNQYNLTFLIIVLLKSTNITILYGGFIQNFWTFLGQIADNFLERSKVVCFSKQHFFLEKICEIF